MGLNIGPVASGLSALRSASEFGQARLRGNEPLRAREPRARTESDLLAARPRREPNEVRAGFGEGTISPLAAALRTIDRTIQGVRETQPTIQDIRKQFQARAAERRAETFRTTRGEDSEGVLREPEPRLGPPTRLIREFAATDDPERPSVLAVDRGEERSRALAPEDTDAARSARAVRGAEAELKELEERVGPEDVRAERVEIARERNNAERPRFDVRV